MSRSLHTDPLLIRAFRRAARPYAPRSDAATRWRHPHHDLIPLPESRVPHHAQPARAANHGPRVRITETRPTPGYHHPASRTEIAATLTDFWPLSHGLSRIHLSRCPTAIPPYTILFGSLRGPGSILLYELPRSPWSLPLPPTEETHYLFSRFGSVMTTDFATGHTLIHWPSGSLRDLILLEVLPHELGHHRAQWDAGKRSARVRRTRDHEALAALAARRNLRRRGLSGGQ